MLRSNLRPKPKVAGKDGGAAAAPTHHTDTEPHGPARSFAAQFPDATAESYEPKVMVPFEHKRGRVPRRIEVERRRRLYETQDIRTLLQISQLSLEDIAARSSELLPLEVFDNTSYESRNPQEWLQISQKAETDGSRFLPAEAVRVRGDGDERIYSVDLCRVIDWNEKTNQMKVRWGAQPSDADETQWIPRVFVHLLGDDPIVYVQRLLHAHRTRQHATAWIKYRLCCDSMPTEGLPGIDKPVRNRIMTLGSGIPQLSPEAFPQVEERRARLIDELTLEWQRTHNRILLEHRLREQEDLRGMVTKSTKLSPAEIADGPDGSSGGALGAVQQAEAAAVCQTYNFEEKNKMFNFATYYTQPEVVRALTVVRRQTINAFRGNLFNLPKQRQMRLREFQEMQIKAMDEMSHYLMNEWKDAIVADIKECFSNVGKGWLNVDEKDQAIYQVSKLRKFFVTVKYMMEDTVFALIYKSLEEFTAFFREVSAFDVNVIEMGLVENRWPGSDAEDAIDKQPLFTLDLVERNGVFSYSTPQSDFEDIIIALFDRAIEVTRSIPQVEKFVLTQYFWKSDGQGPFLDTVKPDEERICDLREEVRGVLRASLAPLQDYLEAYNELLPIVKLDKQIYITSLKEELADETKTVEDLKDEIKSKLKAKKKMSDPRYIPHYKQIGNFMIDCQTFRDTMGEKNNELAKLVMDLICEEAKEKTKEIRDSFSDINKIVSKRQTTDVNKLYELRAQMNEVPEKVIVLSGKIESMRSLYTILEGFQYGLTDEEFKFKWEAIGWPRKLEGILDTANKHFEEDREHMKSVMHEEQEKFQKEQEKVKHEVAQFGSKYTEREYSEKAAKEAKDLNRAIRDCVEKTRDFNHKERLFAEGDPNTQPTNYLTVLELEKEFKPYSDLWITTQEWTESLHRWKNDPFDTLEPDQLERTVNDSEKLMKQLTKIFKDKGPQLKIVNEVRDSIAEIKPVVPIAVALRNPGMRTADERHWISLTEKLKQPINPGTLNNITDCQLLEQAGFKDTIVSHCEVAAKEYAIEKALDEMYGKLIRKSFTIEAYKETKTYILKDSVEIQEMLDEQLNITQQLQFSPFKAHFAERLDEWEKQLNLMAEIIEQWLECQRSWRYLEPIFSAEDIITQLPKYWKLFDKVDRTWRKIMANAFQKPVALEFCAVKEGQAIFQNLVDANKTLEIVQRGLNDYLAEKRQAFPRFYFLSDEELLEILSQSKDPRNIDRHLKKLFEFIDHLTWEANNDMLGFWSGEGEYIPHTHPVTPTGNVEQWLTDLQSMMKEAIHAQMKLAVEDYVKVPREKWVLKWPGQIVLAAGQIYWTKGAEDDLTANGSVKKYAKELFDGLMKLVEVVQSPLKPIERINMGALITIDVHAKDTIQSMADDNVGRATDFDWIKQLRFYFQDDNLCHIKQVDANFVYGGEYLGNTGRLVVTPLTDRIYLTLTGALALCLGGAPAGPAGTGKTETTKDLAKALAKQCVVFNCQEGMTYKSMGKFFKGLAWAGAWACFDEFNRIDVEVLSVVAQQVTDLQQACITKQYHLESFEGTQVTVDPTYAVFITMNPGYAGRTELPDNLKVLFRPVACMVPDYALIGEIRLFSYGYTDARNLAKKMVMTFKLSSEQLSSQDHYDFGMRAVNTVISAAGLNKRKYPNLAEDLLLLRALRDSNVPKFLQHDILLFDGIILDLFPGLELPNVDYGHLLDALKWAVTTKLGLQPVDAFLEKCLQLYDVTILRHGLMVVGPTGAGKTKCTTTLKDAMSRVNTLQQKGDIPTEGDPMKKVEWHVCNPKSITMDQLYGAYDNNTGEWNDGVLCVLFREAAIAEDGAKHWVLFDGPVDALWIESMNTVLDENKKLCLVSGEIIQMSRDMTMMFEVEDLSEASPATVSRCGMIYMEPAACVPTSARVTTYLQEVQWWVADYKDAIRDLMLHYIDPLVDFVRRNLKEYVPTVDNNLVQSCFNVFTAVVEKFKPPAVPPGNPPISDERKSMIEKCVPNCFFFSVIWSVGASCDERGRVLFDEKLKDMMRQKEHFESSGVPEEGLIYDYIFNFDPSPDAEVTPSWKPWEETVPRFQMKQKLKFSDITVPTVDSIRSSYMLTLLLSNSRHVAAVGPTGTGKTLSCTQIIMNGLSDKFLGNIFTLSAQTSANLMQTSLFSKIDKRRLGRYGPPMGKQFIAMIDDANLPQREKYGAQPPIELMRQILAQGGFYSYVKPIKFLHIEDIIFCLSCGPPGGGRNPMTNRFVRYFNVLSFPEMSDKSMGTIFSQILAEGFRVGGFRNAELSEVVSPLVAASVSIFQQCVKAFVPTPAHVHYTFNLRDVARVFNAVYDSEARVFPDKNALVRMWIHENLRVFCDRLIVQEDIDTFKDFVHTELIEKLGYEGGYDQVVTRPRLLYGDYMNPSADRRIYDEITNMDQLVQRMNEFLQGYNDEIAPPMPLVMFMDAIEHVNRIARVLRMPNGHMLLLGIGGSGRKSMTRLAAFVVDHMELSTVEISRNFGVKEWREYVSKLLMDCGKDDKRTAFLFSDTQIMKPVFLEDVASLLTSGDVPNLFDEKQLELISEKFRGICQQEGLPQTRVSIYSRFIKQVRENLHVCVAFTPIGELYRTRMRMFPALINCCTIDWYTEWPEDALLSVALAEIEATGTEFSSPEETKAVCATFARMHSTSSVTIERFFEETKRRAYVTPTSYLSLLQTFMRLLSEKKSSVLGQRGRLENGLEKLRVTEDRVADLKTKLDAQKPILKKTQEEIKVMVEHLEKDKQIAGEKQKVAQGEEAEASEKAKGCAAIKKRASDRLAEAEPALQAALRALKSLKVKDVGELGNYRNPPKGVKRVCEAVAIMLVFGECPKEYMFAPQPGAKKEADWWRCAKSYLSDPKRMLETMTDTYDKERMTDQLIEDIEKYIKSTESEPGDFTPEKVRDYAVPCFGMCAWTLAMITWFRVNKEVQPLRIELASAEAELKVVTDALKVTQAKLKEVEDNVARLEAEYDSAMARQQALAMEVQSTEQKLDRAGRLINGLGGEKGRWQDTVKLLTKQLEHVVGDALCAAASVAYIGPLTTPYRKSLLAEWAAFLDENSIPHSENCDLVATTSNPVDVQQWQLDGLPKDALSTENGLILKKAPRWPLLIDPQGQGNTWIRNMEREGNLLVVKATSSTYIREIEGAVRLGRPCLLENVGENLEPVLEPLLLKQTFKEGTQLRIKISENPIDYDPNFRFYMTTKLPNPRYTPENLVMVCLLNFFITPGGLEDQLLGKTVEKERKELEELKQQLTARNAQNARELKDLQDMILRMLQEAEGDILEDESLIEALESSKKKSIEINEDMEKAKVTEADIDSTRAKYRPHAFRGSLLFFVVATIGSVDPMYQFSLQWFLTLFLNGIDKAEKPEDHNDVDTRIANLKDYFTYSFYANVCRSLFERHKLTFSFYLCSSLISPEGLLDEAENRYFLTGATSTGGTMENPAPDWLTVQSWNEIMFAAKTLPSMAGFDTHVKENIKHYQGLFDSVDAHEFPMAGEWEKKISPLQRLIVTRLFRMDKVAPAIQNFVKHHMDERYIIVPQFNLGDAFKDSSCTTPLIFIISPGSDPMSDLLKFAAEKNMLRKLDKVSLGQGQGEKAEALVNDAQSVGSWVLLQNCHLATSWMPKLEQLVDQFDPDKMTKSFRLWLTSMPSPSFPVAVLQIGVKMTNEPPKGLRANLTRAYFSFKEDDLSHGKQKEFKVLLFSECLFHGIIQERRRYGGLGFNIPYEFNDSDRVVCLSQLRKFLDMYNEVPYDVLMFLTGQINYGGRVTDDWDRRCMMTMIKDYIAPKVLGDEYKFSASGTYRTIEPVNRQGYLDYINTWPINPSPEAFGLHENADITSARNETLSILSTVLGMQAGGGGGSASTDQLLAVTAADIQSRLPKPFSIYDFQQRYPVKKLECMNTVLVQEAVRYNKLLNVMATTLKEFLRALKGEVVMSAELESVASAMLLNAVPASWEKVAYPSLMPLSSWVSDLLKRVDFIKDWYDNGPPNAFWIGGFFFPQAFLTGTLQNYARRLKQAIDTISFGFDVLKGTQDDIKSAPEKGAIIYGLFMEGARWGTEEHSIVESRPKELFTEVPPIFLDPIVHRPAAKNVYLCPVYKTLKRAGTLSTTGHSTNFVLPCELPTNVDADHWIKRGVAMVCGLNF